MAIFVECNTVDPINLSFSLEDLGISQEEFEREMQIYCACEELGNSYHVDRAYIPDFGLICHHGWICNKCEKYLQVG